MSSYIKQTNIKKYFIINNNGDRFVIYPFTSFIIV